MRTPCLALNFACAAQYGTSTVSHWYLRMSRKSPGHGQVTQLGVLSCFDPPGQPLKVITTSVPSFGASSTAVT